jgi:hypothetical protein
VLKRPIKPHQMHDIYLTKEQHLQGKVDWLVVDVQGVQSHLNMEPAELTKQAIGAPLQGGQSRPQDPEAGTIYSFSLFVCFFY